MKLAVGHHKPISLAEDFTADEGISSDEANGGRKAGEAESLGLDSF